VCFFASVYREINCIEISTRVMRYASLINSLRNAGNYLCITPNFLLDRRLFGSSVQSRRGGEEAPSSFQEWNPGRSAHRVVF
jgi:hypothetical protein